MLHNFRWNHLQTKAINNTELSCFCLFGILGIPPVDHVTTLHPKHGHVTGLIHIRKIWRVVGFLKPLFDALQTYRYVNQQIIKHIAECSYELCCYNSSSSQQVLMGLQGMLPIGNGKVWHILCTAQMKACCINRHIVRFYENQAALEDSSSFRQKTPCLIVVLFSTVCLLSFTYKMQLLFKIHGAIVDMSAQVSKRCIEV